MDIPILKYVDILVGLAVVIFLGATIVATLSQFLLWWLPFRSRTLRIAIEELLQEIDPCLEDRDRRSIAELLLRHPLLGQSPGPLDRVLNWLRNHWRARHDVKVQLPSTKPTVVIQRHELAVLLIEWAAKQGPLASHEDLREKLVRALEKNGITDPVHTNEAVRFQTLENETDKPDLPSHSWTEQALLSHARSPFLAKIHGSFDNAMRRATDSFTVDAKVLASILAFALAFVIQLDALSLVRRLSDDESLRKSLLEEAGMLSDRISKEAPEPGENGSETLDLEKARAALGEVDARLAHLRQPKYAAIPETFLWQSVQQRRACLTSETRPGAEKWDGRLRVGSEEYELQVSLPLNVDKLEKAILETKAPVDFYPVQGRDGKSCLQIVARSAGLSDAGLDLEENSLEGSPPSPLLSITAYQAMDLTGLVRRTPGILFSGLLLSLGAPFWFDLLKNLLRFRSVLAKKDDEEREKRENVDKTPDRTIGGEGSSAPRDGEGEAGDLRQVEAVG